MKTLNNPVDCQSLVHRLGKVKPDSSRRWGRMTPHQMVCHLNDLLQMATGERPTRVVANPLTRTLVKYGALYLPIPWPRGFRTIRELDQQKGGTPPVEFERDKARQLDLLQGFSEKTEGFGRHPLFDAMTAPQWMRWAYLHTDHHLRQFGC